MKFKKKKEDKEELERIEKQEEKENNYWLPIGLCLGISIGTAIGAATDNMSLWMSVGISIGLCLGVALSSSNDNEEKNDGGIEVIEYFKSDNKNHWLEEIKKSDWGAGTWLYELLRDNTLDDLVGENSRALLLVKGDKLISFCTYARRDDITAPSLTPWIGFVYTFPEYRGNHYVGKLLEYANELAKSEGHEHIYISTNATGLYETYGYYFYQIMKDIHGEDSRVYRNDVK